MRRWELEAGAILGGRYQIVRQIGSGGMGAVYEAIQRPIDRRVAVKVLNPSLASTPGALQRFLAEARLANQVRHPNVVQVTDFGADDSAAWLVMEYLEGEPLGARMEREGPMPPARAVALLAPVARALAHLHASGIVHRDLKPDNIFLARVADQPEPVPSILDLGIARALEDDAPRLTDSGAVLGTPLYMAPEQVKSARSVTARADQYALACVLYEMLTGEVPVRADNLHGLLVAKITEDPTPVCAHRADVPPAIAEALARALARDPDARFDDVTAFFDALGAVPPRPSSVPATPDRLALAATASQPPSVTPGPVAGSTPPARHEAADDGTATPARAVSAPPPPSAAPRRVGVVHAAVALALVGALAVGATLSLRPAVPAASAPAPVAAPTARPVALAPAAVAPTPVAVADAGATPATVEPAPRPRARRHVRRHEAVGAAATGRLPIDSDNPLRR